MTRLAIITGAAGGMGAATAQRFAADGWSLILNDLNAERLEAVAAPLRAPGLTITCLAGSVADADFSERLLAVLGDRPIGALVHTAGLSPTMGSADLIWTVNYDATVTLAELVRPRLVPGGCAVLIASSSGYQVPPGELYDAINAIPEGEGSASVRHFTAASAGYAYSASKRAVQRLVEKRAMAFGQTGARIMSISPGLIDTPMGRAEQKAHPQMDLMLQSTPLGRYGVADEIAKVAQFLCSPLASFVTGSDIKVDGGVIGTMG